VIDRKRYQISTQKSLAEGPHENTSGMGRAIEVLFEPGAVVELRALRGRETISGYFNDHAALALKATELNERGYAIYVTLNEVNLTLLARAANRARKVYKEPTTCDNDIMRRRWLPLDFDPVRPSGMSATDQEKKEARRRALEVREYLRGMGWPEPVVGDSGNGYHLLYRVDLPNDREGSELIKGILEGLAFKFSDEAVELDTGVHNAARIWKLYGTTARKGDDIKDRPHRRSTLLKVPEGAEAWRVVDREKLKAVAHAKPPTPLHNEPRFRAGHNGEKKFDLEEWMMAHDVPVKREGAWQRDGWRWVLAECPWNGHTDNSAYIVRFASGAVAAGCHHNSCQGLGWRHFREHYEPGCYEGVSDDFANSANSANKGESSNAAELWGSPAPFHEFDLPRFPIETLPGWVRNFVEAEAHTTQTPVDLAAMLSLSVGALACAKVVEVEPWEGWREPTNLFTAIAMPPGSRKSKVFADVTAPVEEFETKLAEEKAPEITEQQTRLEVYEGRLQKAQKAAANVKDEELDLLTAEAMEAARDLASIKVPAQPRLLADDASPERLATLMRDQGSRMGLMSAEGDVFEIMGGRYSQGQPNLGVYLKGHAGDTIRVDRVGRPPEFVKRPALTLGLAVQPDVLRGLADRPGFRGRGLLGRFLYALPQNLLGSRNVVTDPLPEGLKVAYAKNVKRLLKLAPEPIPGESIEPQTLRMGRNAQRKMQDFGAWIEPQLAEYGELGSMTDWAGKLAGAVARIAGILHCMERVADAPAERKPWDDEISGDTLERAIRIGGYLIPHARAAFAEMGTDPTVEEAKHVLRWIERKGIESFTKREAFEDLKGKFRKVSGLEPALDLLDVHSFVREKEPPQRQGPGRKRSARYEVNPLMSTAKTIPALCSQYSQNSHNGPSGKEKEEGREKPVENADKE
jgi:hypothetical protein